MRRSGYSPASRAPNHAGAFVGTLPTAVADLCPNGIVADYDPTTGVVTCSDGDKCQGENGVCAFHDAPAVATCNATPGMIWDPVTLTCHANPQDPALPNAVKTCNAIQGKTWDDVYGCVDIVPCSDGGCFGTIQNGACVKEDGACVPNVTTPVRLGDKCLSVDGCPGTGDVSGACIKTDPKCTGSAALNPDAAKIAKCKKDGGVWQSNACKMPGPDTGKGTGQKDAGSSNTLLYVGGAGLAALLLYLKNSKKGSNHATRR